MKQIDAQKFGHAPVQIKRMQKQTNLYRQAQTHAQICANLKHMKLCEEQAEINDIKRHFWAQKEA